MIFGFHFTEIKTVVKQFQYDIYAQLVVFDTKIPQREEVYQKQDYLIPHCEIESKQRENI